MSTNITLQHPYIFTDVAAKKYYCYGDGSMVYVSENLKEWSEASSDLPELNQPAASSFRDEYRLYTVTDEGILLYVSDSPVENFHVRDYVLTYDESSFDLKKSNVSISHPSIFADPNTREHYLVYGCCNGGIHILHLNPRNGLAFVDGAGVLVAKGPDFNQRITDGFVYYNDSDKSYYLFATYGSDRYGSIRVGKSSHIYGPYLDSTGRDMTDTNNFDDSIGHMICAPIHFDDCTFVTGYSKPLVIKAFDEKLHLASLVYNDEKPDGELYISDLIYDSESKCSIPFFAVPFGMELCDNAEPALISPALVCGPYELVKLTKEVPLPLNDYVPLSLLQPSEQGDSSTRNAWAMSIPHKAGGRVELGGSLRGYWIIDNNNHLIIRFNNTTEEYIALKGKVTSTSADAVILLGTDNNGIVAIAKKY